MLVLFCFSGLLSLRLLLVVRCISYSLFVTLLPRCLWHFFLVVRDIFPHCLRNLPSWCSLSVEFLTRWLSQCVCVIASPSYVAFRPRCLRNFFSIALVVGDILLFFVGLITGCLSNSLLVVCGIYSSLFVALHPCCLWHFVLAVCGISFSFLWLFT